jgi:hypothetical protein
MRDTEKQPTCKVVARIKGYALYENGELWTTGKHSFRVGRYECCVNCTLEQNSFRVAQQSL